MAEISRIASGAPWEPIFGYTRAVKAGGWLAVSGTTGFDENGLIVGRNQMYVQARQAIANIAITLERAGMTLAEVVRTRVFVTDMERFGEVARAHLEAFGANPPASTVVEVRRLVNPDMMIEIEADAYREVAVAASGVGGAATPAHPPQKPRAVANPQASGKQAAAVKAAAKKGTAKASVRPKASAKPKAMAKKATTKASRAPARKGR
jgi:enamine deaminase RidA (YjgF/YER057c/UK114 family)